LRIVAGSQEEAPDARAPSAVIVESRTVVDGSPTAVANKQEITREIRGNKENKKE